jgi:hypothetical protein
MVFSSLEDILFYQKKKTPVRFVDVVEALSLETLGFFLVQVH